MDLKDLVISTLAEIEEVVSEGMTTEQRVAKAAPFVIEQQEERQSQSQSQAQNNYQNIRQGYIVEEEDKPDNAEFEKFLVNLKERVLVLFEGLQTIEVTANKDLLLTEKKIDLTINFLEYLLASIDEKLENPTR